MYNSKHLSISHGLVVICTWKVSYLLTKISDKRCKNGYMSIFRRAINLKATSLKDHWSEGPLVRIISLFQLCFVLLHSRATSLARASIVCGPSSVNSETVKRITAKCFERYIATISPEHFFFQILFIIYF